VIIGARNWKDGLSWQCRVDIFITDGKDTALAMELGTWWNGIIVFLEVIRYYFIMILLAFYSISYMPSDEDGRFNAPQQWQFSHGYSQYGVSRRRIGGAVLDSSNLRSLEERRDFCFPVSLLLRNARPVGHHVSIFNLFNYPLL